MFGRLYGGTGSMFNELERIRELQHLLGAAREADARALAVEAVLAAGL